MSKIYNLVEWLQNNQSYVSSKIEVRISELSGYGIVAKQNIKKGERLIAIRRPQLLNKASALPNLLSEVPDGPRTHRIYTLNASQILTLFLLNEHFLAKSNPDRFWSHFVEILPCIEDLSSVPLTWSLKDAESMPEAAQTYVDNQRVKMRKDYNSVMDCIRHEPSFEHLLHLNESQFLESWLCVNTRCLYMEVSGARERVDNMTMAPYIDFINHSDIENCRPSVTAEGMILTASTDIDAGSELFLCYGAHSNLFLLCEYGFTLEENKWDFVDLTPLILKKVERQTVNVLRQMGYYGDYTLSGHSGMSFRTEVALAALQEHLNSNDPGIPRTLKAFVDGYSDGERYAQGSKRVMNQLITEIIADCRIALENPDILPEVSQLHKGWLSICTKTWHTLNG